MHVWWIGCGIGDAYPIILLSCLHIQHVYNSYLASSSAPVATAMCKLKNVELSVQISFNSWLHEMHAYGSYWSMVTSNIDDNTALSRYSAWLWPRSLIHHSPLQLTCSALLLNSHFVLSVFQPRFYPPWAGLLVGDHLRQSGPSMAAILGPGGPSMAT